ncbi:myelin-associated glycoprotein-like [Cetorhinus maximus]
MQSGEEDHLTSDPDEELKMGVVGLILIVISLLPALHGAWFKYWYRWKYTITYTKDPNYGMAAFVGRAKIIGDLERKNCSVRIDSLRAEDSDVYYFYLDAEGYTDHTFTEPVQLQVLGKMISLSCSSDGNPTVHNFTWFKISQGKVTNLVLAGQTITVSYGFEEEISYYCEATSILGSSQSLPIRIPTEYGAVILPESRCTQYLTNLTCLCLVRTNSSVHITWALPGRTLRQTGSDGIYKTESARVGPLVTNTLTICGSNMAVQTVNCSVVNDRGDRHLQRRLEIQAVGEQDQEELE